MALLTSQQRADLITRVSGAQVTRTTVGPVTTEFDAMTVEEMLSLIAADSASSTDKTKRPFRLQRFVSPGAVS